jgi:predicted dehydrogenase
VRFGLVGTGHWARHVHGEALAAAPEVELVAVYGRDAERTAALAKDLGASPFTNYAAMLEAVDAVAFAVPPDIQAPLACSAANAGKHLLLEKPVALRPADGAQLADAVARSGVASVVFFTWRFSPAIRSWIDEMSSTHWEGASGQWISAALSAADSPYVSSAWRRHHGALWDTGPHLLSLLLPLLGPIVDTAAIGGERDLVHAVFTHQSGATSAAAFTLTAAPAAAATELVLWGPAGRARLPERGARAGDAYRIALTELLDAAATGRPHPCGVSFGREVVEILARLDAQLRAR